MPEPDSVREKVLNFIENNPGVHFREIQRQTGTAVGQLEYHLYSLEKEGVIKGRKDGKFVRFFSLSASALQNNIFFYLRSNRGKEIMFQILRGDIREDTLYPKNERKREEALAILAELESAGIVSKSSDSGKTVYSLRKREDIIGILLKFRESFVDYAANNLINLFK